MTKIDWMFNCPGCRAEIKVQGEIPEANQRNAESGTTDCSRRQDAVLSKENRAFQPGGNPVLLSEFIASLEKRHDIEFAVCAKHDNADKTDMMHIRAVLSECVQYMKERGC